MKIMEDLNEIKDLIKNNYTPAPLLSFKLDKRELSVAKEEDKKVQKLLEVSKKEDSIRFYNLTQKEINNSFEMCNNIDIFDF